VCSLWADIGVRAVSVNLGLRGPLTDVFMHAHPKQQQQQYAQHDRWSSARSQSCMLHISQPHVDLRHVTPPASHQNNNNNNNNNKTRHEASDKLHGQPPYLLQGNAALSFDQLHVSVTLLQLKATAAVLSTALGPLSRPLPEVTQLVESIQFGEEPSPAGSSASEDSNIPYHDGGFVGDAGELVAKVVWD
jgi:hypothetical protein